jgi:hypothetical protein
MDKESLASVMEVIMLASSVRTKYPGMEITIGVTKRYIREIGRTVK